MLRNVFSVNKSHYTNLMTYFLRYLSLTSFKQQRWAMQLFKLVT